MVLTIQSGYALHAQAALSAIGWALYDAAKGNWPLALDNLEQAGHALLNMKACVNELAMAAKQKEEAA